MALFNDIANMKFGVPALGPALGYYARRAVLWGALFFAASYLFPALSSVALVGLAGYGLYRVGRVAYHALSGLPDPALMDKQVMKRRRRNFALSKGVQRRLSDSLRRMGGLFDGAGRIKSRILPDDMRVVRDGGAVPGCGSADCALIRLDGIPRPMMLRRSGADGAQAVGSIFFSGDKEMAAFRSYLFDQGVGRLFRYRLSSQASASGGDGGLISSAQVEGEDFLSLRSYARAFFAGREAESVVTDGGWIPIVRAGDPAGETGGLRIILRFNSEEDMRSCLDGSKSVVGMTAVIDDDLSQVKGASYVSLPVTRGNLSRLQYSGSDAPYGMIRDYNNVPLSPDDLKLTKMSADVRRNGFSTARVTGGLVLADAVVNGMRPGEYQRMTEVEKDNAGLFKGRADREAFERSWRKDAALIQSVDFAVNYDSGVMEIVSRVGEGNDLVEKREFRPLSPEDLSALASRDRISQADMKDTLMRLHPDYFDTYSARSGRDAGSDPVGDLIRDKKEYVRSEGVDVVSGGSRVSVRRETVGEDCGRKASRETHAQAEVDGRTVKAAEVGGDGSGGRPRKPVRQRRM